MAVQCPVPFPNVNGLIAFTDLNTTPFPFLKLNIILLFKILLKQKKLYDNSHHSEGVYEIFVII